jgi:hypothetical protein
MLRVRAAPNRLEPGRVPERRDHVLHLVPPCLSPNGALTSETEPRQHSGHGSPSGFYPQEERDETGPPGRRDNPPMIRSTHRTHPASRTSSFATNTQRPMEDWVRALTGVLDTTAKAGFCWPEGNTSSRCGWCCWRRLRQHSSVLALSATSVGPTHGRSFRYWYGDLLRTPSGSRNSVVLRAQLEGSLNSQHGMLARYLDCFPSLSCPPEDPHPRTPRSDHRFCRRASRHGEDGSLTCADRWTMFRGSGRCPAGGTQLATIRTPHQQQHPWSTAQRSGCRAITPRPAATATATGRPYDERCLAWAIASSLS